jgi:hypothetical protein
MDPDQKKKRGRKKKDDDEQENITVSIDESVCEPPTKKRGRKPKGGKLIPKNNENTEAPPSYPNIILHLKCSMQDLSEHTSVMQQIVTDPLVYNPDVPPSIMTYNSSETTVYSNFNAEGIKDPVNFAYPENGNPPPNPVHVCPSCNLKQEFADPQPQEDDSDISMKDVNAKLKKIKLQLYRNTNPDKRSACFWCTYDFDNPPCYIPKYEMDGQLCGYGSFCRPECAAAFLMRENIDDSTKFERYHLLNLVYSKVYNYKKSIKPAPNPHYLLEKFYGNLTIQEYRKLLKSEHMLLVIEKPMTRILPELHEDTEDFTANIYGASTSSQSKTGVYKVKRQSEKQKGPSKSAIMKDRFGLA